MKCIIYEAVILKYFDILILLTSKSIRINMYHFWYYLIFLKNSITKASHKFLQYTVIYKEITNKWLLDRHSWESLLQRIRETERTKRKEYAGGEKDGKQEQEEWKTVTGWMGRMLHTQVWSRIRTLLTLCIIAYPC